MLTEIKREEAEALFKSFVIPPRPVVLTELEAICQTEEPDLEQIAGLICTDVVFSAAVIKTVNSPIFHLLGKVSSVPQAIHLLGINNILNIVRGVLLRQMLSTKGAAGLENFWINSARIALIAAGLAEQIPGVRIDETYTFGLFHNCGIPLMQARFPNYAATLEHANAVSRSEFIELEERLHKTSHNVVGYLLGRTWFLPEHINLGILNHHDYSLFRTEIPPEWQHIATLIALVSLADNIVMQHAEIDDHREWEHIQPLLLKHLGFGASEFERVAKRLQEALLEPATAH